MDMACKMSGLVDEHRKRLCCDIKKKSFPLYAKFIDGFSAFRLFTSTFMVVNKRNDYLYLTAIVIRNVKVNISVP